MTKDIFLADYSSCRQTNREITSNGFYLDDILELIEEGDGYISTAGGLFNKSTYNELISQVKKCIGEEKTRYSNFYSSFEEFHTPLEDIDAGLAQLLESQLDNLKDSNYDSYVAIINSNEQSNFETSLYYYFLAQGLSNEEALKFSAMGDQETEDLIKKFSEMSPSEYDSAIKELKEKVDKSPAEIFLFEICQFNSPDTDMDLLKDITKEFAAGGTWVSVIEKGMLNRSLSQAKLDANSLTGQLTKLRHQVRTSQLSRAKVNAMQDEYNRLKILRDEKIAKVAKVESAEKNMETISRRLGKVVKVYQVGKIGYDEYKEFMEGGVELDDCIVSAGLEWGGIWASTVAGGYVGEKAGAAIGSLAGPGLGTAAGMGAGLLAGGFVGAAYGIVVKPIGTYVYNEAIEPIGQAAMDVGNDIKDWWDTLWW